MGVLRPDYQLQPETNLLLVKCCYVRKVRQLRPGMGLVCIQCHLFVAPKHDSIQFLGIERWKGVCGAWEC